MHSRSPWYVLSLVPLALAALASAPSSLNLPKALETQRDLVAANPSDASAQVDLGNLLRLDGRTADAEAAYRQAIAIDPASVAAHFDLGLLLQQSGENRDAAAEYKRVIELAPDHAWAHYQLGVIRESSGSEGAAVRAYAAAFALDPRLAFADVNPHVLENKLVTQAMLRAYGKELPPIQPGTMYEDPGRIAGLLVGRPGAPEAGAGPEQPATIRPDAIAEPTPAAPAGAPASPRTLRSQDLSSVGSAGQATGGSPAGRRVTSSSVYEDGAESPDVEIYEPPVPAIRIPTPTNPTTGAPYQPGLPSNGRLEMHLRDAWGREIGRG